MTGRGEFCLDTNVVVDMVLVTFNGSLMRKQVPREDARLLTFLTSVEYRAAFDRFLAGRPRLHAPSIVSGELNACLRRSSHFEKPGFWKHLQDTYAKLGIEQLATPVAKADHEAIPGCGLVDELLVQYCAERGYTLLSADAREIKARARRLEVRLWGPSHLVAEYLAQ